MVSNIQIIAIFLVLVYVKMSCVSQKKINIFQSIIFYFIQKGIFQGHAHIIQKFTSSTYTNFFQLKVTVLQNYQREYFQILHKDRLSGYRNPLIGNLNINSLRNKIVHLRAKMQLLQLHYSVIGGTKLNDSFPTSQFYLIGYNTRV